MNTNLGDRMKTYEGVTRTFLTRRMPAIIRVDGVAFHTFTKGMKKPIDFVLVKTMWLTAKYLCQRVQGCKVAYVQSDEISLLLTDDDTLTTDAWFGKNIQKMASVSASIATVAFNKMYQVVLDEYYHSLKLPYMGDFTQEQQAEADYCLRLGNKEQALFDSRVFALPKEEVCNYFVWRQRDATINAIEALGRSKFSSKQLYKKSCSEIQEMLLKEHDIDFNNFPVFQKRGVCIIKETCTLENEAIRNNWKPDMETPLFTEDRNYIEKYLFA